MKCVIVFSAVLALATCQRILPHKIYRPVYASVASNFGAFSGGSDGRYTPDNSGAYNANDGKYRPDGAGAYVHDNNKYNHDNDKYKHQNDKYNHQADRFGSGSAYNDKNKYNGNGNGNGNNGNALSGNKGNNANGNSGNIANKGNGNNGNPLSGNKGNNANGNGGNSANNAIYGNNNQGAFLFKPEGQKRPFINNVASVDAHIKDKLEYFGNAGDKYDNRNYRILKQVGKVEQDGYHYLYETENGIEAEEQGKLANVGTDQEGMKAQGFYTYTGPDNVVYTVRYTADENGFVPEGAHIPTPPPIPAAILRSLEYQRALGQL